MENTTIIGTGSLGTALGILLARANWPLAGLWSRSHDRALTAALLVGCSAFPDPDEPIRASTLVILAVSDDAVARVADRVRPALGEGTLLLHTSGVHGPEVLGWPLSLAMHPLQSVPGAQAGVQRLPGSVFTLEGSPEARERGRAVVEAVGGRPLELSPGDRGLYHAAATVVSAGLVASMALAESLWKARGLGEQALSALLPLAEGTLANLRERGSEHSLTGPAARGDHGTLEMHWEALGQAGPEAREFYRAMTRLGLRLSAHPPRVDLERLDRLLDA